MQLKKLLSEVEYSFCNLDLDHHIDEVVPFDDRPEKINQITWCKASRIEELQTLKTDSIIITTQDIPEDLKARLNLILVKNPKWTFLKMMDIFFDEVTKKGISKSAIIHPSVSIPKSGYIGDNVVIEEACQIGENVVINHNTVILARTIIRDNVTIGYNNSIGTMGFGYEKNEKGEYKAIKHVGYVVIEKDAEIANNVVIDRATLGVTVIGENVKIDNLVHISHNVRIGKNCMILANSMLAGSVTIGENSWIAPSASILNQKKIGSNVMVGMGAVVLKDVENDIVVVGNPSRILKK